jgi:hypothetical protein
LKSEKDRTRNEIAMCVGALLALALLESHIVSRPFVFVLAPFIFWVCQFVASPVGRVRWLRYLPLTALVSVLGYLLFRYVFTG